MATHEESNSSSPSTTWAWRRIKIGPTAGGQKQRPAAGRSLKALSARNPREPLTIKVSYRGGAECWWEIHARGAVIRRPGHLALHDVLMEISTPGSQAVRDRQ